MNKNKLTSTTPMTTIFTVVLMIIGFSLMMLSCGTRENYRVEKVSLQRGDIRLYYEMKKLGEVYTLSTINSTIL